MAYFLLTLTTLFWAGNFVTARGIHEDFPPLTMSFIRWGLALVIISPLFIPRLKRNWPLIRQHLPILSLLAIVGVASFNSLIYIGLQTTMATNATLMQSGIPIIILMISSLFLGESVSARQWIGVFISLAGIITLIGRGDISILQSLAFNSGDLWVFVAVLCWSAYSVLLRWKPVELDGFTFFGFTVMVAVMVIFPFMLWEVLSGLAPVWSVRTSGAIVYMAICPSILAYIFWNRGVAELGAATAGLFIHLLPLFGLILSVIFLGEQIQTFHLTGMGLIFTGIYLAIISRPVANNRK
ncbi:MAG: DMT family transporter [Amphritea sp.]